MRGNRVSGNVWASGMRPSLSCGDERRGERRYTNRNAAAAAASRARHMRQGVTESDSLSVCVSLPRHHTHTRVRAPSHPHTRTHTCLAVPSSLFRSFLPLSLSFLATLYPSFHLPSLSLSLCFSLIRCLAIDLEDTRGAEARSRRCCVSACDADNENCRTLLTQASVTSLSLLQSVAQERRQEEEEKERRQRGKENCLFSLCLHCMHALADAVPVSLSADATDSLAGARWCIVHSRSLPRHRHTV